MNVKKLIILDIDETLIHATQKPFEREHDFETEWYFVYKRPYVHKFIEFCIEHFKVAVWTTVGHEFAEKVVSELFPRDFKLEFLWSYKRCTPTFNPELYETIYLKNLNKVKRLGYKLEHVIMVDDTPAKLAKNYGNLVRVNEYRGQEHDIELKRLMKYLLYLKEFENVRKVEKRGWQSKFQA